jgi:filamentous hemagglutinin family protein
VNPGAINRLGLCAICSIVGLVPRIAWAQHTPSIAVDGTLGPVRPIVGPKYMIPANLGTQVGGNLFHSFSKFSLQSGPRQESATFTSDGSTGKINNVIGRVTGGTPSTIDGQISIDQTKMSNIAGANLYLINPSGIVFGSHASVSVAGSFHASSADYIKMSDGTRFQATNPGGSILSCAPPAAFGFLNAAPGRITVKGSKLGVPSGQTLDLAGGPVWITAASPTSITGGAALSAPAGTIRVTSVAGPGEIPAAKGTGSKPTVTSYGPVDITNASRLNVSGRVNGGSVFIRAQALTIDGSQINGDNLGSGSGGRLVLRADGHITLSGGTTVHADVYGNGTGGAISAKAGTLSISNASLIEGTTKDGSMGNAGNISIKVTDALSMDGGSGIFTTGIQTQVEATSTGTPGNITIRAGSLSLTNSAQISSLTAGAVSGGSVRVNTGALDLQNFGVIGSSTSGMGTAGDVTVNATTASIRTIAEINAVTLGPGNAGTVRVSISGDLAIAGPTVNNTNSDKTYTGIGTVANSLSTGGKAGNVIVEAGSLSIAGFTGQISSSTFSSGKAGDVSVNVAGPVSIAGSSGSLPTGIVAGAFERGTGNAGNVAVKAGSLSIVNGGEISATSAGPGVGGSVTVMTPGPLLLDSEAQIAASAKGLQSGQGGFVMVYANSLTVSGGAQIASTTAGPGKGGDVGVTIGGNMSLSGTAADGTPSGITASAASMASGGAGSVTVTAPQITLASGGTIASTTAGTGMGGSVDVTTPGALLLDGLGITPTRIAASATGPQSGPGGPVTVDAGSLTIQGGAQIASTTASLGTGGPVQVTAQGPLSLSDPGSGVVASANSTASGNAGSVKVGASQITIAEGAQIASTTAGTGTGGSVDVATPGALLLGGGAQIAASATEPQSGPGGPVTVDAGSLTIQGGAQIASTTAGLGTGGPVQVTAQGPLTVSDPGSGIIASATSTATGDAGSVMVMAPQIAIGGGAQIASSTAGSGKGGSVKVTAQGPLTLTGPGSAIDALATPTASSDAGSVTVDAPQITVTSGAQIASTTAGTGAGGSVGVGMTTPGALLLGGGAQIAASTTGAGAGGQVTVSADSLTIDSGAQIASSTAGPGSGGVVQITDRGQLSLSGGGEITASSMGAGDAGSVIVDAPQITVTSGSQIASTTAGTGKGGSVEIGMTTPGVLMLDGRGTQITASTTGVGIGGNVTISGNSLTIGGGAQIASTAAGLGKGGDVDVVMAGDITLPGPGPQITAQSTGSGDAGKITVSAVRLLMSDGGRISTEAQTANGGNITLNVSDFLYLTNSQITASVNRETGNGGNIVIDPQLVILNHSKITAQAAEGQGGNINISAGLYIASTDSVVSASSQSGISGTVVISGPRVDVNGALVVLSTELRSAAEVLRHSCATQTAQPQSSLVEGGRGGLPQDPDTTLPALYIAGRDVDLNPQAASGTTEAKSTLQTKVHLTMRCG